jgi:hypothetical protein
MKRHSRSREQRQIWLTIADAAISSVPPVVVDEVALAACEQAVSDAKQAITNNGIAYVPIEYLEPLIAALHPIKRGLNDE